MGGGGGAGEAIFRMLCTSYFAANQTKPLLEQAWLCPTTTHFARASTRATCILHARVKQAARIQHEEHPVLAASIIMHHLPQKLLTLPQRLLNLTAHSIQLRHSWHKQPPWTTAEDVANNIVYQHMGVACNGEPCALADIIWSVVSNHFWEDH